MKILAIATILLCALAVLFVLDEIDLRAKLSNAYQNLDFYTSHADDLQKALDRIRELTVENETLKREKRYLQAALGKQDGYDALGNGNKP